MVMLAGPLAEAIGAARMRQSAEGVESTRTIHLTPAGTPLTHAKVVELARSGHAGYVLIAGRYEGIDERLVAREVGTVKHHGLSSGWSRRGWRRVRMLSAMVILVALSVPASAGCWRWRA